MARQLMRNIEDLVELPLDHGGGGGHGDGGDDAGVEVVVERHHQGLGASVQVQLEQSVLIISDMVNPPILSSP